MKIKSVNTPQGKIELKIVASPAKVQEAVRFVDFQLAMQNQIALTSSDELRKAVIERVGEPYYNSFVDYQVMNYLAPFAVTQENLAIVGQPKVITQAKRVDPNKSLQFVVEVMPKPSYELADYSAVKIRLPKVEVYEEEIDQQLPLIAESFATYEADDPRKLENGMDILFEIAAKDANGEPVEMFTAESRAYRLGANYLPVEFDNELIGMEVGQTKTFDVAHQGFELLVSKDAKSNPVITFTVTIKEVQKRVIPAITDAWIEKNSALLNLPDVKTVADLREEVRKQGIAARENEQKNMRSYLAASEFAKRFNDKISDEIYELTRDDILQNMSDQLQAQGRSLQQFVEEQAGGQQQFAMQVMMQTREVLLQGFSLDALARHLEYSIDDADIDDAFSAMAPGHEKEVRMQFERSGRMYQIREGAMRNKANRWLVETATIEYFDMKEEQERLAQEAKAAAKAKAEAEKKAATKKESAEKKPVAKKEATANKKSTADEKAVPKKKPAPKKKSE